LYYHHDSPAKIDVQRRRPWYQFAEPNAALSDGARPAGMANIRVEQYGNGFKSMKGLCQQCDIGLSQVPRRSLTAKRHRDLSVDDPIRL
jgi:hypothetical protein